MKYRRLTEIELKNVEQRFVQFLVANTITADDWAKIKTDDPEKADRLIDIFSELMFETSLKQVQYIKFSEPKDVKIFHCGDEKMTLMGLKADDNLPVDFTKPFNTQELMQYLGGLHIYKAEKAYNGNREQEIYQMMENGCLITDEKLYQILEKLHTP